MAKLRRVLTHPGKNESGQGALAMVLLLLMLGAVILTPLLVFMQTGLGAGRVYESKLQECYAAEAGVEDAIWKIKNGSLNASYPLYSLDEEVNDRNVTVTINNTGGGIYLINSTATSDDGGSTTIETYVSLAFMDFSDLLDSAITSMEDITIKNGVEVTGNVTSGGEVDNKGIVNGNITENAIINWPTAEQLSSYYLYDVEDLAPPFPYSHPMDIAGTNTTIEALYRDGPLDIYNSASTAATLTLNGTVYVTGDVTLGSTTGTSRDFTLNLNNQTIFIESASADPQKALEVVDKCTIIGSGCIIAVGDVYFAPKGDVGSEGDFVLIMSVEGTTILQPSGTFYGCMAGDVSVEVKSGFEPNVTWTDPGLHDLNFPMGDDDEGKGGASLSILSWQIK